MKKFTKKIIHIFNIITITALLTSCKENDTFYINNVEIKNGDLLFQQSVETQLEEAIKNVTTTDTDLYSFTHVGIVYKVDNEYYVIEAAPSNVKITPINKFLMGHLDDQKEYKDYKNTKQNNCNFNRCVQKDNNIDSNIDLSSTSDIKCELITVPARLKKEYRYLIKPALKNAQKYINMDYDYEYLPNNNKVYCSELIYLIFKEANNGIPLFKAKPMTFKIYNKEKDSSYFSPLWVSHYNKLHMPIPEGIIGTNPADMAKSDVIELLDK